ncbi:MAG: caspase family protein [Symploca sp. SIO3E6]|nr:caspase family protein [Caldora sp. SIO3E6]
MARSALVVGIETYDSQYLNNLSKSVNDARDFAKLLVDYGSCPRNQITLLKGQVTGDKLIAALKSFLNQQAKNQEAIIYFSGHGVLEEKQDSLTEEVVQKGYLAASDCQLTQLGERWLVKGNAIPLQSLRALINKAQLSSLIFILDACHSGVLIQEIDKSFQIFQNNTTYYFLAACQAYEESWAKKSKPHSEFTGALLEALSQDRADEEGVVTVGQAFEQASKLLETGRQKPTFLGKGSRLPLVTYPVISLLRETTSQSLQITDDELAILQPYLEQIDKYVLTWAMMEGISASALNSWLAVDESLSIESFFTIVRERFPKKPDGSLSIISVLQVLRDHPRVALETRKQLKGWLQARVFPVDADIQVEEKLNSCLLVVVKQEHPGEPLHLTAHLQLKHKAPIPILLKPNAQSPYQAHPDNGAIMTCQVSADDTLEEKIAPYLQDLLNHSCDIYLRGSPANYKLVLEIFFPFDYLAESVDLWRIKKIRRQRQLGHDYRLIVRSYERLFDPYYAHKLEMVWQLMKSIEQKVLPTRVRRIEQEEKYCYSNLEQELTEQQSIGLSCFLPETEAEREELFFALHETGIPLALWLRSQNLDNDGMLHFEQLLCPNCLQDHHQLIEQLFSKRRAAHFCSNPEKHWGYHAAMLLDNPERTPPLNPAKFGL